MADGNVTITTAANFIPEMWRDAILDYAERKISDEKSSIRLFIYVIKWWRHT